MIDDNVSGALLEALVLRGEEKRMNKSLIGEAVKLKCQLIAIRKKLEVGINQMTSEEYSEYLKRVK